MVRYAQFVIGPAGCGKSTYCSTIQKYANSINRIIRVINLDPDAEYFDYEPYSDIRNLISMDDLKGDENIPLGPNGGLVYCLEYLERNLSWLDDEIGDFDDDYFIFDLPGQIELYCHLAIIQKIIDYLKMKHNFNICTVFILDCHFLTDPKNYLSSSIIALASTLNLACPHINLMMKVDMLSHTSQKKMSRIAKEDFSDLCLYPNVGKTVKYQKFLQCIAEMVDDGMLGGFLPLNKEKYSSISSALYIIDNTIAYGEDLEPNVKALDDYYNTDERE